MHIVVEHADTADALFAKLGGAAFDFVTMHMNCDLPPQDFLKKGNIQNLHGATSCLGSMTTVGRHNGVSGFAISDPDGAYGTGLAVIETDVRAAAQQATQAALAAADRMGEQPDVVWISFTPGGEEEALAGIEDIVGHDVPIIGGSAADNSVEGNWYVLDGASHSQSGVVVSVLFPSEPVSFAYQNGYAPTEKSGVITKTDGRQVLEIDDQPAMQVYSNWTGGAVAETPMGDDPQPILSDSTMWPLGRPAGALNDVPFYLLAHPAVAHGSGAMDLFATVIPGEEITLMHGTQKGLVERAGRVASLVRQNSTNPATPPIGALMIYCGGCMLSVQDHLDDVVTGVNTALDGAPFLGAFTFGEQGPLIRGGNRHGNLMISCIIFG